VPYPYYAKLGPRQKAIYRRSDEIVELSLPGAIRLRPSIVVIEDALLLEDRRAVQHACADLSRGMLENLELSPVGVKVLAARPSHGWGELHGEYQPGERGQPAAITIWMRTAHHKKVVAFRTFLRTLLHELCHHIDYELLKLDDSFHTEGFFKRESSLFKQLVTDD